jgi:saccharopine dehydrogenase-like NADP-dependent oxidoreductase
VSENSKSITKLIEYISEKYFDKIDEIDIAQIHKDETSGYYKGTLKVKLR